MTTRKLPISDFWKNTWSSTIGTVIGIVLTFGTTFLIQRCEREENERTAALMVIHNIDNYCERMQESIDNLEELDSINGIVFQALSTDFEQLPDSIILDVVSGMFNRQISINDNTADKIFSSSLDIWKNIEDSRFIENAGKCFSGKAVIDGLWNERNDYQNDLLDYYKEELCFDTSNSANEDMRTHCKRVLSDRRVKAFMVKTHELYVPALKAAIQGLRDHNEINKRLMQISTDELETMRLDDEENNFYPFDLE